MKIENEDLTQKIRPDEEILLVSEICDKYDNAAIKRHKSNKNCNI